VPCGRPATATQVRSESSERNDAAVLIGRNKSKPCFLASIPSLCIHLTVRRMPHQHQEPDGSLLTPPELLGKRTALGQIQPRVAAKATKMKRRQCERSRHLQSPPATGSDQDRTGARRLRVRCVFLERFTKPTRNPAEHAKPLLLDLQEHSLPGALNADTNAAGSDAVHNVVRAHSTIGEQHNPSRCASPARSGGARSHRASSRRSFAGIGTAQVNGTAHTTAR
jgi:hypothetical protein